MLNLPPKLTQYANILSVVFILVGIWDLIRKGIALRYAAQKKEKIWYTLLLIINSIGILPIIYLIRLKKTGK